MVARPPRELVAGTGRQSEPHGPGELRKGKRHSWRKEETQLSLSPRGTEGALTAGPDVYWLLSIPLPAHGLHHLQEDVHLPQGLGLQMFLSWRL